MMSSNLLPWHIVIYVYSNTRVWSVSTVLRNRDILERSSKELGSSI